MPVACGRWHVPDPTETSPLVSVRGEATLEVDPEVVRLSVIVSASDKDRRHVLERLSKRNDECLALIKGYGEAVEDIETRGFTVHPELRDRRGEKVRGYRGGVRIHVTLRDFSVVGELVSQLGDQEMTSVNGPWWGLRRDSDVHRRARHEAARAAVTRAREYAEAIGARLTGLVELADEGLTTRARMYPTPDVAPGMALAGAPSGPPEPPALDLEPQTQIVTARVEARFTVSQPADL
ncbi:MAG: DUF541 domain-containing protein [Streptosporangiales bacterium]|nr:DUF541 domain-containing protein [Streptosporangiales bacterium]